MERKIVPLKRINTRITPEQHAFIKAEAKKTLRTEGQVFRMILDYYLKQPK